MDLTIYNVIQGPIITEKSSDLMRRLNQVVLQVHPAANKILIKQAVQQLFEVQVDKVRIIVKHKRKRRRAIKARGKLIKKAIITLKPGYSLSMNEGTPEQAAATVAYTGN